MDVCSASKASFNLMPCLHAAPELPVDTLAQIWQSWELPKLLCGIGMWFKGSSWPEADRFMGKCAAKVLKAPSTSPYSVLIAELGWRSMSYWISYHRCRVLSKMIRAQDGDTLPSVLRSQVQLRQSLGASSWLNEIIQAMEASGSSAVNQVSLFIRSRLGIAMAESSTAQRRVELENMRFETLRADDCLQLAHSTWKKQLLEGGVHSERRWYLDVGESRAKIASLDKLKRQRKRLRTPAPVFRARLSRSEVRDLAAARAGSDPRAMIHPANPEPAWSKWVKGFWSPSSGPCGPCMTLLSRLHRPPYTPQSPQGVDPENSSEESSDEHDASSCEGPPPDEPPDGLVPPDGPNPPHSPIGPVSPGDGAAAGHPPDLMQWDAPRLMGLGDFARGDPEGRHCGDAGEDEVGEDRAVQQGRWSKLKQSYLMWLLR